MGRLGELLLPIGLAALAYGICALYLGIRRERVALVRRGYISIYVAAGALVLSTLLLCLALLTNQFQLRYVAEHSSRALPFHLKLSALWAGQEGSLLLWSTLQTMVAALVVARPSTDSRPLLPWAALLLSTLALFFVAASWLTASPFREMDTVLRDGQGLNPLLRHLAMVLHPPALYLGYVGLSVPFAFALAGLLSEHVGTWPTAARRWTLAAWLFLGLGLLLGARWAYDVLGWGGYWSWDPVENAGLMPWLTATALLHGMALQEQRSVARAWNILLAVITFALVLFDTFTTRSGLIQSVHAFGRSVLGPYLLLGIIVTLVGSLWIALRKRTLLQEANQATTLLSRQGLTMLTMFVLLALTASVFIGSLLPTLTQALTGQRFVAGPAWFDRVTGPQFGVLLLLMGVCPLVGYAAETWRQFGKRVAFPVLGGILVAGLAYATGLTQPFTLAAFTLVGMAGIATAMLYVHGALVHNREKMISPLASLGHLVRQQRRRYAGYLVHVGIILMAVGIIGTRFYEERYELHLAPLAPTQVGRYTLVYQNIRQEIVTDHVTTRAILGVYLHGRPVTELRPQIDQYGRQIGNRITVPAVRSTLSGDLYVILAGWEDEGAGLTLLVYINPLISWLWIGGVILLIGGAVALAGPALAPLAAPARATPGAVHPGQRPRPSPERTTASSQNRKPG